MCSFARECACKYTQKLLTFCWFGPKQTSPSTSTEYGASESPSINQKGNPSPECAVVISGAETSNVQTNSLLQHGQKEAIIASPIGRAPQNTPESTPRVLETELQVRFVFARARSRLHPREKQMLLHNESLKGTYTTNLSGAWYAGDHAAASDRRAQL